MNWIRRRKQRRKFLKRHYISKHFGITKENINEITSKKFNKILNELMS
ncbi:MAG: hypothetical protein U9Q73_01815 [Nanoarchaeota archaeon]|nr:hypothetical protein [Nanoarchaeota archaeon]